MRKELERVGREDWKVIPGARAVRRDSEIGVMDPVPGVKSVRTVGMSPSREMIYLMRK